MSSVIEEMKYETVAVRHDEHGIAWVSLNRPEKRNAMSPTLHYEMTDALKVLETEPSVRVIVITGAGDEAFSAGQDLKEFFRDLDDKPGEKQRAAEASSWRFQGLWKLRKPTIAMVNGYCFGGAFPIVIACDIAVAAEEATFGLSEVNWGIFPAGMVSRAMHEAVGYRDGMYYTLTGETFDGAEAKRIGMVTEVVPKSQLEDRVLAIAKTLCEKNPAVLAYAKEAYKACRNMDFEEADEYLRAKSFALQFIDREDGRTKGMTQFLNDKTYRPGFEAYNRG